MFKAQVSRPGPNKHEWAKQFDGWMPGWHTLNTGTEEQCAAVVGRYRAAGGAAYTRVVSSSKRDDED